MGPEVNKVSRVRRVPPAKRERKELRDSPEYLVKMEIS